MNEQRSGPQGRPMGNMVSGVGLGGGMDSQDRNSQMARRGGGSHLGSTMRMNISVETLPHRLVQPKSRKGDTGDRHMAGRDLPSMSPETSYGGRGGREHWGDMHGGRTGGPSMGQSSARGRSQANYGYGSRQSANSSRGYDFGYGGNNGGGGGGRDGQYSDRSRRDSYGGHAMRSSQSDSMQRRMGSPSQGKVQDFLGATPSMSLCDFDVHSNMEWNQHTNGLRYAENRKHPQMGHERPMQDGVKRPAKRESSSTSSTSSKTSEEPPFKKPKEEKVPEGEKEDDVDEEEVEKIETKERPDTQKTAEWNQHTNGLRYAENRKHPQMYPDWDPGMAQNISGGGGHHMDTPNLFVGMLGLIPMSPGRSSGGMPSSWGGGPSSGLSNKGLPQEQLVLNKEGMRVVNLVGFRRGYGFLGELLALAKPFGDVVKHLVLDLRPEAFLQFASEEEAKAMARFYNSNVMATVCGKPVRIRHSQTYPTIQTSPRFGASKVVYASQLPSTKYKEEDVLQLVESFGKVRKYLFNRIRRECFIEMEEAEDAKRLSDFYGENPPKIQNKQIGVCISRKYNQLTFGGHERPMQDGVKRPAKRESSSTSSTSSKTTEEPPFKKPKEEKVPEGEKEDDVDEEEVEKIETKERPDTQKTAEVKCEEGEVKVSAGAAGKASQAESPAPEPQPPAEAKPPSASLPLDPFDPETPLGVEHVKMGYYCRVCFFFYYNENTAKKVHCSSKAHYDKLKNHLEKEQAKAQNPKKGRK